MEKNKSPKKSETGGTSKRAVTAGNAKEKKRSSRKDEETGFLVDAALNIESSAREVSKKAGKVAEKIGDQTTEIAGKVLEKLKKGATETYEAGSKAFEDLSNKATEYLETYENSVEMRRLREKKNELAEQLGHQVYTVYKQKKINVESLLSEKEIDPLVQDMNAVHKEIVKLGRKISQKK
jgi:hypothetical protein